MPNAVLPGKRCFPYIDWKDIIPMKRLSTAVDTSTRIAAYLRVSTEEQKDSGLGIAAQRTKCGAMTTVKGWPAPTFYIDESVSGKRRPTERPAMSELLAAIERKEYDVVIIAALDRLARSTRIVLDLVERFDRENVTLVSCRRRSTRRRLRGASC